MRRWNLITKEKSKAAYQEKNEWEWEDEEGSINDDLESFVNHLQEISSLEEVKDEELYSFFLPKLTKEELKLVKEKNSEHMETYGYGLNYADVKPEEMKKSDSKDKHVHGRCVRKTWVLNQDDFLYKLHPKRHPEFFLHRIPPPIPNFQFKLTAEGKKEKNDL